ncbi:WD40 repeat-like protein [Aulographum hederae CBS 113979]|uniref:WD40 repeat-like protein n=1 Tax=Aulographum hederae CBS 113979 TaxID=1176131 RepID=A0A6G1H9I9_9PEZI|nr:WD40 repeat-like protein [Aulographum hederae CBS 113979]
MATEVVPLQPVKTATGPSPLTPDQIYWSQFSSQAHLSSPGGSAVTHISSPLEYPAVPYISASASISSAANQATFAITTGPRIILHSTSSRQPTRTLSRLPPGATAYSGSIRRDGRVLAAGSDSGLIQVYDVGSRAILKTWHEHRQPVWVTKWHPSDLTSLMSCSDDATVRLWDLPSETAVRSWRGHADYARSGSWLEGGRAVMSGSYDGMVKIWDPRVDSRSGYSDTDKAVLTFKMPGPVEAVLPMPGGTSVVASAENKIAVLDLVAGRPMQVLSNHQKTVSALALASKGKRVLSGGLDGHVKVFDSETWNVVAGFKYQSPVLSLSVVADTASKDTPDKHLVVGLQSGVLSVRTRLSGAQKVAAREKKQEMAALAEGKIEEYDNKKKRKQRGKGWEKRLRGKEFKGEDVDIIIDGNPLGNSRKLQPWERLAHKGMYSKALDVVFEPKNPSKAETLTLLTHLVHSSALRTALSHRTARDLQPILRWLVRAISDPRYIKLTVDVALIVLDLYSEHFGDDLVADADEGGPGSEDMREVRRLIERLHNGVRRGCDVAMQAVRVEGMVGLLGVEG